MGFEASRFSRGVWPWALVSSFMPMQAHPNTNIVLTRGSGSESSFPARRKRSMKCRVTTALVFRERSRAEASISLKPEGVLLKWGSK